MIIEEEIDKKYVGIWLTKKESEDPEINELLKPIIDEYNEKKIKPVIFHSGNGDLLELTKMLLSHNKDLAIKG